MKIFSCCISITYENTQKKTPAKALILQENFGGFRGFMQKGGPKPSHTHYEKTQRSGVEEFPAARVGVENIINHIKKARFRICNT